MMPETDEIYFHSVFYAHNIGEGSGFLQKKKKKITAVFVAKVEWN